MNMTLRLSQCLVKVRRPRARLPLDGVEEDTLVILETESLAPRINFLSSIGRLIQMFRESCGSLDHASSDTRVPLL
jgi:hypothetical protein